jgi:hypothetical protein
MLFDGRLDVGDFAVKTREWEWKYRGPVLFYTSSRVCKAVAKAYGYRQQPDEKKAIIGIADLVDVRELTEDEAEKMVCNFNNITRTQWRQLLEKNEVTGTYWPFIAYGRFGLISPFHVGFFFKDKKKFSVPVPFNWAPGPVKPIFIETSEHPQLSDQMSLAGK